MVQLGATSVAVKDFAPEAVKDEPEVVASVRGRQHVNGIVEPVSQLLFFVFLLRTFNRLTKVASFFLFF